MHALRSALLVCVILLLPIRLLHAQWVETPFSSEGGQGIFVHCFAVSGTNLFAGTDGAGVFLSTDNGSTWTPINAGLGQNIYDSYADIHVHSFAVSATNLFVGTDRGVFLSTNNGASWDSTGLMMTFVHALAVFDTNLFAGTGGGVFLSTNNGTSWTPINAGLGNVSAFVVSGTNLIAGTNNCVFLSANNGTSWTWVNTGLPHWTVVNSLAVSGTNLFAGTDGGVFLSTNNGTSWTAVNTGLPQNTVVNSLAVSGTNLFTGTDDGNVLFSTNNGTTWSAASSGLTAQHIYSLAVSGTNLFTGTYGWVWWTSLSFFSVPSIPSLNSPVSGSLNQSLSPVLFWSKGTDSFSYHLQVSKDSLFSLIVYDDSTIATDSSQVGSLQSNTVYYWRVKGSNFVGSSGWSTTWHFTTLNLPPHAVALISVYQFNSGTILSAPSTFSSSGSYDTDGAVDSVFWYVDGRLVSQQPQFTFQSKQGTTTVMLVVEDNQGAKDTSIATVNRSMFKVDLNGPVYAGPSLLGGSILYVIGTGDAVYRMDAAGNPIYSLQVGGEVRSSSSIAYDTTVYIASSDKNLYAFSKYGNAVWAALPLGGVLTSTPAIDSARNQLYLGVSNKNFVAVNRSNGSVTWNFFANAPIVGSAVVTLNGKLVFATVTGTIYGFDLNNMTLPATSTWQLSLSDSILSSPAVDASGYIYYCTASGKVVKVSMQQGSQASTIWQAQAGGRIVGSPVIDGNGTLYVGCEDSNLYAINTQNGSIKWTFNSGAPIESTPAISDANMIYFGNDGGKVCALDTSSAIRWYYQDGTAVQAPLLYENGTLYVGTVGGRILAFYDDADSAIQISGSRSGLSKSAVTNANVPVWGTFQGNNQRNGVPVAKTVTGVNEAVKSLPTQFSLSQNYPNPFNPSTIIHYGLPAQSHVRLQIYNILGQVVADLVKTEQAAGWNQVVWNANVASGLYFYRLEAVSVSDPSRRFVDVKKMILLK